MDRAVRRNESRAATVLILSRSAEAYVRPIRRRTTRVWIRRLLLCSPIQRPAGLPARRSNAEAWFLFWSWALQPDPDSVRARVGRPDHTRQPQTSHSRNRQGSAPSLHAIFRYSPGDTR